MSLLKLLTLSDLLLFYFIGVDHVLLVLMITVHLCIELFEISLDLTVLLVCVDPRSLSLSEKN